MWLTTTVVSRSVAARLGAYRVYTLAWTLAGVALVALSAPAVPRLPPQYALLAAMCAAGHLVFVLELPGGLRLSVQPLLVPVWLYGWRAGPPLALLGLPLVLWASRDPARALLYFGSASVWAALAGGLFDWLRPPPSPNPTWAEVGAALASGAAFVAGHLVSGAFGRYLATGQRAPLEPRALAGAATYVFAAYVLLGYMLLLALQTGPAAAVLAVGVWLLTALTLKGLMETRRTNERLQAALAELERLSVTDPLTGLWNRRHFVQILPRELHRHARTGRPLSLLVVDLRSLKQINDAYGHQAGDRALQHAAEVFRRRLRGSDLPFRIGGDEFALLLPDTPTQGAVKLAEAVVDLLARARLDGVPEARLEATVGVATYPHHADEPDALVAAADRALYRAREEGRCVATPAGRAS